MSTHVIAWKSTINGRTGVGKKRFTEEEAIAVAKELNEEYPDITHAAMLFNGPPPDLTPAPEPEKPVYNFVQLSDSSPFPFGPTHKGKPMKDVPSQYLDWLSGQPWIGNWPAVAEYIQRNRTAIDLDLKQKDRL